MSAKTEVKNSKISLIESMKKNKLLFFLVICGIVFVAVVSVINAKKLFTKIPIVTPGNPHPNCKIGGCNSELCMDKNSEDMMSICMYSDEYVCLKQDICTVQKNGKCGWSGTDSYQKCIKDLPTEQKTKEIPVM